MGSPISRTCIVDFRKRSRCAIRAGLEEAQGVVFRAEDRFSSVRVPPPRISSPSPLSLYRSSRRCTPVGDAFFVHFAVISSNRSYNLRSARLSCIRGIRFPPLRFTIYYLSRNSRRVLFQTSALISSEIDYTYSRRGSSSNVELFFVSRDDQSSSPPLPFPPFPISFSGRSKEERRICVRSIN